MKVDFPACTLMCDAGGDHNWKTLQVRRKCEAEVMNYTCTGVVGAEFAALHGDSAFLLYIL